PPPPPPPPPPLFHDPAPTEIYTRFFSSAASDVYKRQIRTWPFAVRPRPSRRRPRLATMRWRPASGWRCCRTASGSACT
ncbi:hypothetical protein, partial [Xylophilus sp. ASV27]|uniref:hypothetical protein n=1 Tax=Xylophilus sp. ASV27 TaxID=2795129 RepID=UPI0018EABD5E